MKTKTTFVCVLLLLICCSGVTAQKKKASKKGISTAWSLHKEMTEMIDGASFIGKMYGPCYPMSYLKKLGKKGMIPNPKKEMGATMDSLSYLMIKLRPLNFTARQGYSPLSAFMRSKSYGEFVNNLYYKNIGDLNPPSFAKDVDTYYRQLKDLKANGFILDKRTVKIKECAYQIETKFKMDTWEGAPYPDSSKKWTTYEATISGKLVTDIQISCECKGKSISALKDAHFRYEMPTTFVIEFSSRGNKQRFVPAKKNGSLLNLLSVNCCKESDISFEDPGLEIVPTEDISLPSQTIGVFGGVGFEQDFEEVGICFGAEYLYNVTDLGNNPLFVGANVQLETSSFMDNTNTWVGFGPTVQLFTPLTPSQETHLTNGVSTNVVFGTNENNGSKDDISGYEFILNTGLFVPLSDNLSLAIMLPVLTFTNLTFEAENGGASFEQQNTSLFIGKGSSTKLGLRFGF
jgi:hypothetical protein